MQPTQWRPVLGYEGLYEVSDRGEVRSLERTLPHPFSGTKTYPSKILSAWSKPPYGYVCVKLYKDGHGSHRPVHRLVLEAFVSPRPEGMEGCHYDGDPSNNAVGNLRWDTRTANAADMLRHGRHHNTVKTHCAQGHKFTEANTYYRPSRPNARVCRTCLSASQGRYVRKAAPVNA